MESLYQETNLLVQRVQLDLGILEGAKNENDAQKIIPSIYQRLKQIDENCQRLDVLTRKEPPHRRRTVKYKVDQLRFDYESLQMAVNSMHMRLTNHWRAIAEREELLTQRFRPNETTLVQIEDNELVLHDRLKSSHSAMDELIGHSSAILEQIRLQGMGLRGIKRKILDVGVTLGLSSTTLRIIEKRLSEDSIIFCVGCIFVLLFMYVFYQFWKS
ncbi:unnamed protein product [Thelazia callipaeda]|uniref:Golgi SNAP receptor complex member 2 n=1 Tax=Thelazia callipaeda TaxID=103827 RepID=A0A0N5CZ88_THECL|nr:unnamed protein product [Thelazia callipaeda]